MKQAEFQHLMEKYIANELSEQEFNLLWDALKEPGHRVAWTAFMHQVWEHAGAELPGSREAQEQVREQMGLAGRKRTGMVKRMAWWAAACLVVLSVGISLFNIKKNRPAPLVQTATPHKNEVRPGGNRAMLTLADGSVVELDSTGNGVIGNQGNTKVTKLANGRLAYQSTGKTSAAVLYNTMRTPRGGQYQVTLPDGTKVWLNAASSLTYPVTFTGAERLLKVTGEVYFEASQDPQHPLRIQVLSDDGGLKGEVTVLGTHFNINAYDNEGAVKTTLLQGAIKVSKGSGAAQILRPGQQARIDNGIELVEPADMEEITAWKEGYFKFSKADVGAVMRQAERWYDIKAEYPNGVPDDLFSGSLPRNVSLPHFLEILEYSDINASVKGRSVIVNP